MNPDEHDRPFPDDTSSTSGFTPPALTHFQRAEWIAADQYRRWKNGERIPAEEYLKLHPDLDAEAACDVIYGEFLIREDLGEAPKLHEYLARFPHHADGLRRLHDSERLDEVIRLLEDIDDDSLESSRDQPSPEPLQGDTEIESDPEILAGEFGAMPKVVREAADADSGAEPTEKIPKTLGAAGRYQLLGEIGRGGMGAVIRGHDSNLGRDVAIKILLNGQSEHREIERRFLKEAQITGQLEHPNIVPVYELSRREEDDQPFYTMRFVLGQTLRDAIVEFHQNGGLDNRLELQKLLAAFINVCQAVGYANSRGVVHRDLKPANVAMGSFGEVLVLDWGLAKLVGKPEQVEPTDAVLGVSVTIEADSSGTMGKVGSPPYMAPEQVEVRHDLIDGRTDVYALGGILFEILTGKPPVEGSTPKEIFDKILAGTIPRARDLVPTVSRPLDAICSRAMARDRAERYAKATDLAEDVRRWIADEPVSACPEPFADRARRWAKRNRTAVATLLMGLVCLGPVAIVQTKTASELARKNGELTIANQALAVQRGRAEDREARAIAVLEKFGDVVASDVILKNTPQLEDLRKRLLSEPLAYFRDLRDRLQADRDTRPESLARLAEAIFNLGYLNHQIGDPEAALLDFQESRSIRQRLVRDYPDIAQYQSDLARSHDNIGNMLQVTGRSKQALKEYELALAIQENLAAKYPAVAQFRSDLATSHYVVGDLLREQGKPEDGLKALKSAVTIQLRLVNENRSEAEFQNALALSYNSIGLLLSEIDEDQALSDYKQALSILTTLVTDHPTITLYKIELASTCRSVSSLSRAMNLLAPAMKLGEVAFTIDKELADVHPSVVQIQRELAASYNNYGNLLMDDSEPAKALNYLELALPIWQKLADAHPTVTQFQSELATCHNNINIVVKAIGEPKKASTPR